MPLSTLERPERWNSLAPVHSAILAMFSALTPQPGMIMIRPVASLTSSLSKGSPFSAVCWQPEVKILSTFSSMSFRIAPKGSLTISKARWKVTLIGSPEIESSRAAEISLLISTSSTDPSAFRQPSTTPSTPTLRQRAISASMVCISSSQYRKSPPRGRTITWRRVF